MTGEVLFTCDKLPNAISRSWTVKYGVTIDGQLYLLGLDGDSTLRDRAEKFMGRPVLVEGTMKDNLVSVTNLELVP